MIKNTKDIIKKQFFSTISMGAIRYRYPIRLVPTYLLPAKKEDFCESFSPIALKLTN